MRSLLFTQKAPLGYAVSGSGDTVVYAFEDLPADRVHDPELAAAVAYLDGRGLPLIPYEVEDFPADLILPERARVWVCVAKRPGGRS